MGQVTGLDTGFLTFGLVILPVLLFVGLVTFNRVLQSAVEDLGYAMRINDVRRFYVDTAPELSKYLAEPTERRVEAVMTTIGVRPGPLQPFLTTAGMVEVLDAVLAGAIAAFVVAVVDRDRAALAIVVGVLVAGAMLLALHGTQLRLWRRAIGELVVTAPGRRG